LVSGVSAIDRLVEVLSDCDGWIVPSADVTVSSEHLDLVVELLALFVASALRNIQEDL